MTTQHLFLFYKVSQSSQQTKYNVNFLVNLHEVGSAKAYFQALSAN